MALKHFLAFDDTLERIGERGGVLIRLCAFSEGAIMAAGIAASLGILTISKPRKFFADLNADLARFGTGNLSSGI